VDEVLNAKVDVKAIVETEEEKEAKQKQKEQ
jgi:hypothetical protein